MAGTSKSELDAVGCEICLEILIEPITMPCAHRLCKVSKYLLLDDDMMISDKTPLFFSHVLIKTLT